MYMKDTVVNNLELSKFIFSFAAGLQGQHPNTDRIDMIRINCCNKFGTETNVGFSQTHKHTHIHTYHQSSLLLQVYSMRTSLEKGF